MTATTGMGWRTATRSEVLAFTTAKIRERARATVTGTGTQVELWVVEDARGRSRFYRRFQRSGCVRWSYQVLRRF